jgi:hypothetical protein
VGDFARPQPWRQQAGLGSRVRDDPGIRPACATPIGRRACCPEHTETDIWQQDIDEKLQGHNLITPACGCEHTTEDESAAMVGFRALTRQNVPRLSSREQVLVIHVTQAFAAGCRIVAA